MLEAKIKAVKKHIPLLNRFAFRVLTAALIMMTTAGMTSKSSRKTEPAWRVVLVDMPFSKSHVGGGRSMQNAGTVQKVKAMESHNSPAIIQWEGG